MDQPPEKKPECLRCGVGLRYGFSISAGYCYNCQGLTCPTCYEHLSMHSRTGQGYKCLFDATYFLVPIAGKEKGNP